MLSKVRKHVEKPSEWLMIAAGLLVLISVPIVAVSGDFKLWFIAKVFFGVGVLVMLFER